MNFFHTICLVILGHAMACAQVLQSSNLPIVVISTGGQPIGTEKQLADLSLIDNPSGQSNHPNDLPAYEGRISIRLRGNYSAILPQKPYAFETVDEATGLDTSVSLLGMPAEEDWVLLATWNDKSFVRNALMFELARATGQWAPHTRHVELVLNGSYQGIYVFCEKIKRDAHRLALEKMRPTDNQQPELSGGYIFTHDYGWDFATDQWRPQNCPDRLLNFEMVYPKIEDISPAQLDYISGYLELAESALFSQGFSDPASGFRQYIDPGSWADYFLLSEVSGNVDAYKKSMYFHKERNGLLKMGPLWDFDWALKPLLENSFPNGAGWLFQVDPCTQDVLYVPYFQRLLEDTTFQQQVCDRWSFLRSNVLDTANIFQYIDSTVLVLDEAKTRHFQRWQCLGYDSGASELPPFPATYAGEVARLKAFVRQRLAWMDAHLPTVSCQQPPVVPPVVPLSLQVLPNIGRGHFNLLAAGLPNAGLNVRLFNAYGQACAQYFLADGDNDLDLGAFPAGAYFLQAIVPSGKRILLRLVVE